MPIKKNKSPKNKVSKVESLKVADGKSEIEKIKDLEDLLGVKQTNPFGTTSKELLAEKINEMSITDLQTFAIKIGILPSGNKLVLKNKITKAFKSHAGAGAGYNIGFNKPLIDPSSNAAANILKISQEGM
tara:strand:+ start:15661 stop:16050 length:390 start_codon:yes stop_codon:yes gene_type:complete